MHSNVKPNYIETVCQPLQPLSHIPRIPRLAGRAAGISPASHARTLYFKPRIKPSFRCLTDER